MVGLYSEEMIISGTAGPSDKPLQIGILKAGDRTVSDQVLAEMIDALKQTVEAVPGVALTITR